MPTGPGSGLNFDIARTRYLKPRGANMQCPRDLSKMDVIALKVASKNRNKSPRVFDTDTNPNAGGMDLLDLTAARRLKLQRGASVATTCQDVEKRDRRGA